MRLVGCGDDVCVCRIYNSSGERGAKPIINL